MLSANQIATFFDYQYIPGRNHATSSIFCMGMMIKEKDQLRLPLLVLCVQLHLLPSQTAGIFDHQYLQKKSISILDFLHRDNPQRKIKYETTSFGWV